MIDSKTLIQNSSSPGLAALISPKSPDDFLNETWPHEPFVIHGQTTTVQELTQLPFLQSLESLFGAWPYPVQAHLPDVADEASSVDATPTDARKLFANRMALLFNRAHLISPVLQKWLTALQKDLSLPAMTNGRCMIYATPDGKGTAPHFDQNVNFVLQLRGTKRWWLAPNAQVKNPTQRHTMNLPIDPELGHLRHGKFSNGDAPRSPRNSAKAWIDAVRSTWLLASNPGLGRITGVELHF